MTDQTRWGIPELHLKNKIKKYQDDNYRMAKEHASRLTDQNKQKLVAELQKGMQKDHGSV
jgi:Skp family chaperone for outer membrane proteins